jgi:hypothetical protein
MTMTASGNPSMPPRCLRHRIAQSAATHHSMPGWQATQQATLAYQQTLNGPQHGPPACH